MKRLKMIIINRENIIQNKSDLLTFCDFMDQEVYDENSQKVNDAVQSYLLDVLQRMELVNMSLHERISEDLDAFAIVNFELTADFTKTEVQVFSKNKEIKPKKRDKIVFDGIVERYFKGLKSLWDRFMELDLDLPGA